MRIPLAPENLDRIVETFQREGYVILTDVDPRPADMLTERLSELIGVTTEEIVGAGRPGSRFEVTAEMRRTLARTDVWPELRDVAHEALGALLTRLIGPIVHTSRDFHYQLKPRSTSQVVLKGYGGEGQEVQALYGTHNEFTAARVITSPSAVVCWIPLDTYDAPALHLYPGSHRLGLVANRWLSRQVDELDRIGPAVEYRPQRGEMVVFHFLTMHGSGAATDDPLPEVEGDPVRISCDLRFFPFCGVLDSTPTSLVENPIAWIEQRLGDVSDDLLQAPLLETLAYLGRPIDWPELPAGSTAHWARFIEGLVSGDEDQRRGAIEGLVNVEVGFDPVSSYHERFADASLKERPFDAIRDLVPA